MTSSRNMFAGSSRKSIFRKNKCIAGPDRTPKQGPQKQRKLRLDATMAGRLRTVLEMIKFEHSVFALPFALTGALLAARASRNGWEAVVQQGGGCVGLG